MDSFKKIFESRYTWIEGFMRNVRRFGGRMAIIDPESQRQWTYSQLNEEVNRLSNSLIQSGFKKGDVLMLLTLNCPEFAFAYVTAHKIQGVCCPISFRSSAGEIAFNISDSKPNTIIVGDSLLETLLEAIKISSFKPSRVIVAGKDAERAITAKCAANQIVAPIQAAARAVVNSLGLPSDFLGVQIGTYNDFVKGNKTEEPPLSSHYNIYRETTRLYTSGTTGRPKGVCLTSINELLSSHDVMIHFPMSYKDVTMNTTPWFHRGGLHCAGPCPALYAGSCMVVLSKFDPKISLQYVSKYKITFLIGVPAVLEQLADEQEKQGYDLSSLTGIVTMGSPLERSACIRYQKVLTPNIFNGYGTTETFWNTFLRPFDLPENAGTAGTSCIDDDVRVVKIFEDRSAEPEELAATDGVEVGEVIISSPAKSPFIYFNNPQETDSKYHNGFIYTHDLATWDENHFVTIVGRKDDMIISSGENIYPTEIEAVLNTHPKVKDCIVTSVPDKKTGQMVTAYIVKSDESLTPEELDEYCKNSPDIANFKRPRYYRFTGLIPFNATGKKLHMKIKEQAEDDFRNGLLYRV